MGADKQIVEVRQEDRGEYFQSLQVRNIEDGFQWELVNTYGPVQDEKKEEYLQELGGKIKECGWPMIIGGDFNLVRRVEEKSSGNVDVRFMVAFNDMIDDTELLKLHRGGSRYTWTNKQVDPIQSVLDRVLVNNNWEDKYPLVRVTSITRIGSNHNPLIVDTCAEVR